MTRWDLLEELFELALPLDVAARQAVLDERCADDPSLRAEVLEMVAASTPEHALAIERLADTAPTERDAGGSTMPADSLLGCVIGRWRIVSVLGRGGMASVYRAERADGEYRQQAALKLVSAGAHSDELLERFRTERQVLAQLSHPNIARLVDGGIAEEGRPYLVMELVDGAPITTWCNTHELGVADRLRLFRVVCEAVQHAHGSLVVHRDLKPANTFVTAQGEVKLLDFGIAKILEPGAFGVEGGATRERLAPLTPEYAAPEQMFGGAITTATDVYSLGVLLYELLTGKRPYRGTSLVEAERAIASNAISPPSKLLGLSRGDDLDSIVLTALRAQPERRYTSAGQLGEDIARYLDRRPVVARPDTIAYRARRFIARNRLAVVAATLFTLSVVGFAVVALWQARRASAQRDVAELERDKSERVIDVLVHVFQMTNPNVRADGDKLTLRQVVTEFEPQVIDGLRTEPVVQARMSYVFGRIRFANDDVAGATKALEGALAAQEQLLGPNHPDTIETLYELADVKAHMGDLEGSNAMFRDVLARDLAVYGPEHDLTARTLLKLTREDRLAEAKQLIDQALAIRRKVLPPRSPELAETLGTLGQYYTYTGKLARAREVYEEAVAMFVTPDERRNPIILELLQGLAKAKAELGDHAGAEQIGREAVAAAEAIYGAGSFAAASATHNLGVNLLEHISPSEGEAMFRKAYERHREVLGANHWQTINIERDLGIVVLLQGRYRDALALLDDALAASASLGSSHTPMRHHIQGRRAITLARLGRGDEAIALAKATLAEATTPEATDAGYIVVSLRIATALVLLETDRAPEAIPFARKVLADAGDDKFTRALAKCLLGTALMRSNQAAEGRAMLAEALPRYREYSTADPALVTMSSTQLADN